MKADLQYHALLLYNFPHAEVIMGPNFSWFSWVRSPSEFLEASQQASPSFSSTIPSAILLPGKKEAYVIYPWNAAISVTPVSTYPGVQEGKLRRKYLSVWWEECCALHLIAHPKPSSKGKHHQKNTLVKSAVLAHFSLSEIGVNKTKPKMYHENSNFYLVN